MVTLDAINVKIAKLQKQAAMIAEKQSSTGLTKIRDLMHKHGLSVADIESFVGKKRGRKPSALAAKGDVKAPRASVHHVEPKYADPKTGATWSGRGRAPAWISDVKDRSKFLIEAGAGTKTKSAGAKAAPAEKATVKRVAAKKAVARNAPAKKAPGRRAASPADGMRARKTATPAKKAASPRKVAAKKAPAAVEVAVTPETAAQ
ncbi:H-NS histone family protein [Paraburkholderia tagetis]|uniref:H-NS histone family protein n=1 Tax=Paraburkholderia tagetis TaxID=2913261 RepID=A0A9X2A169_9BURK|nr:H-NS histone family protein [Paraburkholderia tagetis]MCG5078485.1 H-NS histone family protein [Paraburkholderia tagetis]